MQLIGAYEAVLPPGGWPSWVLGNHDQRRIASRLGPAQARVAMVLLLTLRGTPTLYYGDELGLENVPIPAERERDPFGIRQPGTGQGRDPGAHADAMGPDCQRAASARGEPWLPLGEGHARYSVQAQKSRPGLHARADPRSARSQAARARALARGLEAARRRRRGAGLRPELRASGGSSWS